MPDVRQETLKQIQEAWDAAQAQLQELRDQVEKTAQLAQAKVTQSFLERDLDRAYRDLGEAVWAQVSKGRLQLPKDLSTVLKALEVVTKKIQEQNASINDLLSEGAEVASRLKPKLVTGPKKR
jgi:peptidoglycan hydrolase CwlO-like protein